MEARVTLSATVEAVSIFTQDLETHLHKLPFEIRTQIVLAVHELLVNIVRHAYRGLEGQIEFEMVKSELEIKILVFDYAENGFSMPDRVSAPDTGDLPEGGMGLYIIQQAFDLVEYEHLARGNRWWLLKTLGDCHE